MFGLLSVNSNVQRGPNISIHCPRCRGANVPAETYEQVDDLLLAHQASMSTWRNTFVYCAACRAEYTCRAPLRDLVRMSADQITPLLAERINIIALTLAIAGIVLCWLPGLGLALAAISLMVNWRASPGIKALSWISLACCLLALVGLATLIVLSVLHKN